jgi:hypothetical protein
MWHGVQQDGGDLARMPIQYGDGRFGVVKWNDNDIISAPLGVPTATGTLDGRSAAPQFAGEAV